MNYWLMFLLSISGFGLIVYESGWLTALGVFLFVYSHNLEKHYKD